MLHVDDHGLDALTHEPFDNIETQGPHLFRRLDAVRCVGRITKIQHMLGRHILGDLASHGNTAKTRIEYADWSRRSLCLNPPYSHACNRMLPRRSQSRLFCGVVSLPRDTLKAMSLPQRVTKTHATGNDFVVYLDKSGKFEPTADEVRFLCDRHFGIGGDGLIRLTRPDFVSDLSDDQLSDVLAGGTKWFMDYRNADGSLAEMCGNGTRAITLFAQREGVADSTEPFRLGTRAGVKILTPRGNMRPYGANVFQVEMGEWKIGETDAYEVTIPGTEGSARGTFVDMGNPHVVAVIEDAFASLPVVESLDLVTKPVVVSGHRIRPGTWRIVRVDDIDQNTGVGEATMRVNERGCGETLSCGTGLCATGIVLRAKTGIATWDITVRGGTLRVDVTDSDVKLTGAATLVADIDLL